MNDEVDVQIEDEEEDDVEVEADDVEVENDDEEDDDVEVEAEEVEVEIDDEEDDDVEVEVDDEVGVEEDEINPLQAYIDRLEEMLQGFEVLVDVKDETIGTILRALVDIRDREEFVDLRHPLINRLLVTLDTRLTEYISDANNQHLFHVYYFYIDNIRRQDILCDTFNPYMQSRINETLTNHYEANNNEYEIDKVQVYITKLGRVFTGFNELVFVNEETILTILQALVDTEVQIEFIHYPLILYFYNTIDNKLTAFITDNAIWLDSYEIWSIYFQGILPIYFNPYVTSRIENYKETFLKNKIDFIIPDMSENMIFTFANQEYYTRIIKVLITIATHHKEDIRRENVIISSCLKACSASSGFVDVKEHQCFVELCLTLFCLFSMSAINENVDDIVQTMIEYDRALIGMLVGNNEHRLIHIYSMLHDNVPRLDKISALLYMYCGNTLFFQSIHVDDSQWNTSQKSAWEQIQEYIQDLPPPSSEEHAWEKRSDMYFVESVRDWRWIPEKSAWGQIQGHIQDLPPPSSEEHAQEWDRRKWDIIHAVNSSYHPMGHDVPHLKREFTQALAHLMSLRKR